VSMCTGLSETLAQRPPVRAFTALRAFVVDAAQRETAKGPER